MEETVVHVEWTGPKTLKEVANLKQPTDAGVYAIYGPHTVYGQYTLVYIGKASRSFAGRILREDHPGIDVNRKSEIRVHVGRLKGHSPDEETFEDLLSRVESLLIYAHAPGFNSNCITDQSAGGWGDLRVFNRNESGLILPEVSSARFRGASHRYEPLADLAG